jgi:hypothetical protein
MYSDRNNSLIVHPFANSIRTILLIHADEELKKTKNLKFKINSETVSYNKSDDLYVMLEDTLYDSSNNKSEVYSVSSCNSWQKFTPSDVRNSSSIKLFSHNLSTDPIHCSKKLNKFVHEKNDKTSTKINRSPSLKKKDLINEINLKSDLKPDVFNAYRKLKKLAYDLKNIKRRKSNLLCSQTDTNAFKNALKDNGSKVISSKYSSNNSSFLSDHGNSNIFFACHGKSMTKVVDFQDSQDKSLTNFRGNFTPNQKINEDFFQVKCAVNKPITKKYSFPTFNKSNKKVNCFNIKLNKCMQI